MFNSGTFFEIRWRHPQARLVEATLTQTPYLSPSPTSVWKPGQARSCGCDWWRFLSKSLGKNCSSKCFLEWCYTTSGISIIWFHVFSGYPKCQLETTCQMSSSGYWSKLLSWAQMWVKIIDTRVKVDGRTPKRWFSDGNVQEMCHPLWTEDNYPGRDSNSPTWNEVILAYLPTCCQY